MLDAELADAVKLVASRYGMSVASYMRSLVRSALDAEARGIYAPAAIARYVVVRVLSRLGLVPLPIQLLAARSEEDARRAGAWVGSTAQSLGIDAEDLLLLLAEGVPGAIVERGRVLLLSTGRSWERVLYQFIAGLAEALGLRVARDGRALVIELRGGGGRAG